MTETSDFPENIFNSFQHTLSAYSSHNKELVTIIMPAFNNQDTIEYAAYSILNQTHDNLELIIVDDNSQDGTFEICKKIVTADNRVKYLRNNINSGAYYSRNRGIQAARGEYVTVLDADDWSFPTRIAYQVSQLKENDFKAHLGYYIRLNEDGFFTAFKVKGDYSYDGVLHKCLASLMIKKDFFDKKLGYWDTVRFGADSELYERIKTIDGNCIKEDIIPLMIALDRDDSLTKNPTSALGCSARTEYASSFSSYHKKYGTDLPKMKFPQISRPFDIPQDLIVSRFKEDIITQTSVFVIGTCRVHRPFIKNTENGVLNNIQDGISISFCKSGYFHSALEIEQFISWSLGLKEISQSLGKYIFRKENPETTPYNIFDSQLESGIRNSSKRLNLLSPVNNLLDNEFFLIEICSMGVNFDNDTGMYLHYNPNFASSVSYKDLPKTGIYGKDGLDLNVSKYDISLDELVGSLKKIKSLLQGKEIFICGHLVDPRNPNEKRSNNNSILELACSQVGVRYIELSDYVEKYGFRIIDGVYDIHHLSNEGEIELGKDLQALFKSEREF
ncbi:glycosyltransferase family 2 protein [Vreelandella alkaliphila]|uniref:glycosyltransferase family 2 protein n=1 Tax=Vreelandella alkaliphila TaxID=272774 RepID=UPI0039F61506